MLKEDLETLVMDEVPYVAVLHQDGYVLGYVLITPDGAFAVMADGNVIKSTDADRFESFWLPRLNCEMSVPVSAG